MSTAANHRKRSHRSQRMHYQAAGTRQRKAAASFRGRRPSPFRGWLRSMFRKIGQHERAAEGGTAE